MLVCTRRNVSWALDWEIGECTNCFLDHWSVASVEGVLKRQIRNVARLVNLGLGLGKTNGVGEERGRPLSVVRGV